MADVEKGFESFRGIAVGGRGLQEGESQAGTQALITRALFEIDSTN
jgi:hypothetical protein